MREMNSIRQAWRTGRAPSTLEGLLPKPSTNFHRGLLCFPREISLRPESRLALLKFLYSHRAQDEVPHLIFFFFSSRFGSFLSDLMPYPEETLRSQNFFFYRRNAGSIEDPPPGRPPRIHYSQCLLSRAPPVFHARFFLIGTP